jgi:hypothetical protein
MMSTRRSYFIFGALVAGVALIAPATAFGQVDATAVTDADIFNDTMIDATQKDHDTITVEWALGTGEPDTAAQQPLTGFRVYYSKSNFSAHEQADNVVVDDEDTMMVDVNGLEAGTTYYFRIAGVNAAGVGALDDRDTSTDSSGVATNAMTADAPRPSIPTSVMAKGGDGTLMVSWTAPFAGDGVTIDHYRVQKREVSGGLFGDWIPMEDDEMGMDKDINHYGKRVAGDMTSITFMDLDNGTTYQARVMAVNNAGGMSDYSVRDGDNTAPGDEAATVGDDDDDDMTETPALPLVGILLLGAGLVAAGRRRLQQ